MIILLPIAVPGNKIPHFPIYCCQRFRGKSDINYGSRQRAEGKTTGGRGQQNKKGAREMLWNHVFFFFSHANKNLHVGLYLHDCVRSQHARPAHSPCCNVCGGKRRWKHVQNHNAQTNTARRSDFAFSFSQSSASLSPRPG